ncbi:MAG: hypothetical protein ACXABO_12495 [Promethearchaeota archaeon]
MSLYETLSPIQINVKKKVCILGGQETYKDEFQKRISSNCLPIENKNNIGVNISKTDFFHTPDKKFEFLLWNIDCRQRRVFLRTTFYHGSDALIIFISEKKITQIKLYFDEIHSRMHDIIIIFCVILDKMAKKDIMSSYTKTNDFKSILNERDIQIHEISAPSEIFRQISTLILKRIQKKELESNIIIDFISINKLLSRSTVREDCDDYFEPATHNFKTKKLVNTELLVEFIHKLDLEIEFESLNWVKIKNQSFGTFSIYLKKGNVYYFPKICEKCKDKKCQKYRKSPYFICIEAEDSRGWTNIKGFNQDELIILTKIIALKEGNEKNLPKSVLKQIDNINRCEKK